MANPFDQFDKSNPFDKFDAGGGSNESAPPQMANTHWDLPEITSGPGLPLKTTIGMLSSSTPEQQLDVLMEGVPGTTARTMEKDGNKYYAVKYPQDFDPEQKEYFVNSPGFSLHDITPALAQTAAYIATARGGQKAMGGKNPLIRAGTVGAAAGGTSIGLDKLSELMGSKQGVGLDRALVAAGAGSLFELAAPMFNGLWRSFTANGRVPTVDEAKQALRVLGYSSDELTDDAVNMFIKNTSVATDDVAAASVAQSESLPVPVKMTKGQASQKPAQQMYENQVLGGAYGDDAAAVMRNQRATQEQALRENIPAIQSRLSGGSQQVIERGQGAAQAQAELAAKRSGYHAATKTAYDAAEQAKSGVGSEPALGVFNRITATLREFADPPKSGVGLIRDLKQKIQGGSDVAELYKWRRRLNTNWKAAKDNTEREALGRMRREFDKSMAGLVEQDLLQGNKESVALWRNAIGSRKALGELFENRDIIQTLTETVKDGGERVLKVDPTEALNYIFGRSGMVTAKQGLRRSLMKLKSNLSPESWNALREEAFLKFSGVSAGGMDGNAQRFSGAKLMKEWQRMNRENPEVVRTLFQDGERKLIGQWVNVAAKVTNPVRGGHNPSGTSLGMVSLFKQLANKFMLSERGLNSLAQASPRINNIIHAWRTTGAKNAMPLREVPVGVVGGIGAANAPAMMRSH